MRKLILLVFLQLLCFFPIEIACCQNLVISEPLDGGNVEWRPIVRGSVDRSRDVWVIVHPLETTGYWVQPRVTVSESGHWSVQVYIGGPGAINRGSHFEIKAIAGPSVILSEGQVFDQWPAGQLNSRVIEVIRN